MLRKIVCAVVALVVCVGIALADELKGKVENVDADKGTISVKVEGKEKAMKVNVTKDTKIEGVAGVKDIKPGANVTVTYKKEDKKMIIQAIKVEK